MGIGEAAATSLAVVGTAFGVCWSAIQESLNALKAVSEVCQAVRTAPNPSCPDCTCSSIPACPDCSWELPSYAAAICLVGVLCGLFYLVGRLHHTVPEPRPAAAENQPAASTGPPAVFGDEPEHFRPRKSGGGLKHRAVHASALDDSDTVFTPWR